jgi:membrane-bound inhibitor of C-type lysozyme
MSPFPSLPVAARFLAVVAALGVAACGSLSSRDEEAAKNTFACQYNGERLVIRFDAGEARMLMPGGERVSLYQIPAASGVRFSNGLMELRGKGMDLQLTREGTTTVLVDCQPYAPPK